MIDSRCAVTSLGASCQGTAGEDNLVGAWVKVPEGTCSNIVNICTEIDQAPIGTDADKMPTACEKVTIQIDEEVIGGRLVDKFGESL